jgi:hypothetical protein
MDQVDSEYHRYYVKYEQLFTKLREYAHNHDDCEVTECPTFCNNRDIHRLNLDTSIAWTASHCLARIFRLSHDPHVESMVLENLESIIGRHATKYAVLYDLVYDVLTLVRTYRSWAILNRFGFYNDR